MELELGKKYNVTVKATKEKLGIIVEMEDGSTQLIHISNLSEGYVNDVTQFGSTGDHLIATCITGERHDLELSLTGVNKQERAPRHLEEASKDHGDRRGGNRFKENGFRSGGKEMRSRSFEKVEKGKIDNSGKSLDEMIDRANRHLQEKLKRNDS